MGSCGVKCWPLVAAAFLLACAPTAQADATVVVRDELLNADFASSLDSGWTSSHVDYVGHSEIKPLPDGGAKVRKVYCGSATLTQAVALDDHRVEFTTSARLTAQANRYGYYSHAAIRLAYLDADGARLGETWLYTLAGKTNWKDGPTVHRIKVPQSSLFQDLELDVADELRSNLPGVKPADVRGIVITLEAFCSGRSAC